MTEVDKGNTNMAGRESREEAPHILLPVQDKKKDASKSLKKQEKEARKAEKKEAKKEEKKAKKQEKKDATRAEKDAKKDAKKKEKELAQKAHADREAARRQKQLVQLQSKDPEKRELALAKMREAAQEADFWGEGAAPKPKQSVVRARANAEQPRPASAQTRKSGGELFDHIYKKAMCNRFMSSGKCSAGKDCVYAHGWEEFRGKVRKVPKTEQDNGPDVPLWQVSEKFAVRVREKPSFKAGTISTKEQGAYVRGVKFGIHWVQLVGELGFIAIVDRSGQPLLRMLSEKGDLPESSVKEEQGGHANDLALARQETEFEFVEIEETARAPDAQVPHVQFGAHQCLHCFDTGWLSEGEPCYCAAGQHHRDVEAERMKHAWVRRALEGGEYVYQNSYTGEVTKQLPPILQAEWETRWVESYGMIYFNRRTQQMHFTAPPIPSRPEAESDMALRAHDETRISQDYFNTTTQVHFTAPPVPRGAEAESDTALQAHDETAITEGADDQTSFSQNQSSYNGRFGQQWREHIQCRTEQVIDDASAISFFEAIHAKATSDSALSQKAAAEEIEREVLRATPHISAEILQVMLEEIDAMRSAG